MARWAPRDGLGLEGQRDRHGDSARLPPEDPIEVVAAGAAEAGRTQDVPEVGHRLQHLVVLEAAVSAFLASSWPGKGAGAAAAMESAWRAASLSPSWAESMPRWEWICGRPRAFVFLPVPRWRHLSPAILRRGRSAGRPSSRLHNLHRDLAASSQGHIAGQHEIGPLLDRRGQVNRVRCPEPMPGAKLGGTLDDPVADVREGQAPGPEELIVRCQQPGIRLFERAVAAFQ